MSLHLCYRCLCTVVTIAQYLLVIQSINIVAAAVLMCDVDGMWGPWKMLSKKGESGVWWRAELQPAYHVFKGAQGVVQGAAGGVGSLFNKLKR